MKNTTTILNKFNERLPSVLSYTNELVVIKYARTHKIDINTAKKHFQDLKKFLLLCAVSNANQTPSQKLDDLWHTFILFTIDYQKFCIQYLGKFIHHVPEVHIDETVTSKSPSIYIKTYKFAKKHFGDLSEDLWPAPKKAKVLAQEDCRCGRCRDEDDDVGRCGRI